MFTFETLHHMKNHRSGRHGFMALKLDMSKAYDRVEWVYLENLMARMGFCPRWIALVMSCVKTVTYSIMVNGEPMGMIHPKRGIRQGDPISPFLSSFVLKVYMLSLNTRRELVILKVFPYAREVRN